MGSIFGTTSTASYAPTTVNTAAPAAAPPALGVQGNKPGRQNMNPSFLGQAATPGFQSNVGGKTLLGQ